MHACKMVPWQPSVTFSFHLCLAISSRPRSFIILSFSFSFSFPQCSLSSLKGLPTLTVREEGIKKGVFWDCWEIICILFEFLFTSVFPPYMRDYSWHDLCGRMSSFGVGDGLVVVGVSVCDKLTNSEALCHSLSDRTHPFSLTISWCLLSSSDRAGREGPSDGCVWGLDWRQIVQRRERRHAVITEMDGWCQSMASAGLVKEGGMNTAGIEGSSVSELEPPRFSLVS